MVKENARRKPQGFTTAPSRQGLHNLSHPIDNRTFSSRKALFPPRFLKERKKLDREDELRQNNADNGLK
jgi:hypothetical protein